MIKVFIDGSSGTTGLQIHDRLAQRKDLELITLSETQRRDIGARQQALNSCDIAFLCLPDDAAREAVALVEEPSVRIIDASTAHRTSSGWDYGFPELSEVLRQRIARSARVANPGCYASGFIALVRPLVERGLLSADAPVCAHGLSGYTGAGKSAIAQYESAERSPELDSPRHYALGLAHKHVPEMMAMTGLTKKPIFMPVVCDYPQGMVVSVPLFLDTLADCRSPEALREVYRQAYGGTRFLHVMPAEQPEGGFLSANGVVGVNDMEIFVSGNGAQVLLSARFDNLGKGASGAAVQNMNLMLGLPEETGLI